MMPTLVKPDWWVPVQIIAGTTTRHGEHALPVEPAFLKQVHGNRVVSAEQLRRANGPLEADAVVGEKAGDICAVRTADCLPALFCTRDGDKVAAAHAGWRGLAAGVLEHTVAAMGSHPSLLQVWLGPAISQAAFEVGDEVREEFIAHDPNAADFFESNDRGRWQADLQGLARQRLASVGVTGVVASDYCTYRDGALFYSYRRNPDCGRMVSFIAMQALEKPGRGAI